MSKAAKAQDVRITLRLPVAALAQLDLAASREGLSRSAWLRERIRSEDNETGAHGRANMSDQAIRHQVYCGLPDPLFRKVEAEAKASGLRRGVYIRRILHSHLYEGRNFRAMSAKVSKKFGQLNTKFAALNRMVNTVERAVKAIVRDHKEHELSDRLDQLLNMEENITAAMREVEKFTLWATAEEHLYWKGADAIDSKTDDILGNLSPVEVGLGGDWSEGLSDD